MQLKDGESLEINMTNEFDSNLASITSRIEADTEMPPFVGKH